MWMPTLCLGLIEHDFKNVLSVLQETNTYDIKGNVKKAIFYYIKAIPHSITDHEISGSTERIVIYSFLLGPDAH